MKVTLYTVPNCGNCNVIKQLLKAKQVEVEEINLSQHEDILSQLQAAGVRSMPLLSVENVELGTWQRIMEAISNFIKNKARLVLNQVDVVLKDISGRTYFNLQPHN